MTSVCRCSLERWDAPEDVRLFACRSTCGRVFLEYSLLDEPYPDVGSVWWKGRATALARFVRHALNADEPLVRTFRKEVVARLPRGSDPGAHVDKRANRLAELAARTASELQARAGETLPFPPTMVSVSTSAPPAVRGPTPSIRVYVAEDHQLELHLLTPEMAPALWAGRLEAIRETLCLRYWPEGRWLEGPTTLGLLGEASQGLWSTGLLPDCDAHVFLKVVAELSRVTSPPGDFSPWATLRLAKSAPRRGLVAAIEAGGAPGEVPASRYPFGEEATIACVARCLRGDAASRSTLDELLTNGHPRLRESVQYLAARLPEALARRLS